jgi:hypothetical protein
VDCGINGPQEKNQRITQAIPKDNKQRGTQERKKNTIPGVQTQVRGHNKEGEIRFLEKVLQHLNCHQPLGRNIQFSIWKRQN